MASNRVSISSTNRGPLLNVVEWILLVIMCLATLLKVFTKWIMVQNLQHDDAYMIAAMAVAHIIPCDHRKTNIFADVCRRLGHSNVFTSISGIGATHVKSQRGANR